MFFSTDTHRDAESAVKVKISPTDRSRTRVDSAPPDTQFISLIRSTCRQETVDFRRMKKQFAARHFSENVAREKLTRKTFHIYGE
jgi:hypothetical protein